MRGGVMTDTRKNTATMQAPANRSFPGWDGGTDFATVHAADTWHHTEHHAEEHAPAFGGGADDALGLYLKQMGAIPLLTRAKELALAERLETARRRYRHAVLFNWFTLRRVAETFRRVQE